MDSADLQQSLMYPTEVVDASSLLITILHRVKRNGAVLLVYGSTETDHRGANCDPYRVRHLHSQYCAYCAESKANDNDTRDVEVGWP